MKIALNLITPPDQCPYLPEMKSMTECDIVSKMTIKEYEKRLLKGWRHFGRQVFRPVCENCEECKSLRIPIETFKPNRSQARNIKANTGRITLEIEEPNLTSEIMNLYDRFHEERSSKRDWPEKNWEDSDSFENSFLDNPFQVEQWVYREQGRLCGVGYVDRLVSGLSAIYFFHEPELSSYGLGIYNVLAMLNQARQNNLPYLYLGYYVKGCQSLEYKAGFKPNEILTPQGIWVSKT